jgi:GNAT superfamily N-acetyltransferase
MIRYYKVSPKINKRFSHYLKGELNINGLGSSVDLGRYDCNYSDTSNVRCVVALNDGTLVGWVKGYISNGRFFSHGTWVHSKYRKMGVGLELWAKMIKFVKPRRVVANAITDRGFTLIRKVKEVHQDIEFGIYEDADRKLRDLRKDRTSEAA